MNRRNFIKKTGMIGASAMLAGSFIPRILNANNLNEWVDISIIEGGDYFANTEMAVLALGGMKTIVSENDVVGILINAHFDQEGAYVSPDVAASVIKMVYDAGAGKVILLQNIPEGYWDRSENLGPYREMLSKVEIVTDNTPPAEFNDDSWVKAGPFEGAVSLTKPAEMVKAAFEMDKLINIPIAKHHATTLYTGALKNTMGLCTRKTNVGMHLDSGVRNDPDFLAQCIADLNLFRPFDLIVVDASEVITTNGPSGPGEIEKHQHIVAGRDIVAIDAFCSEYAGFSSDEILTTQKAAALGIGSDDLSQLTIMTVAGK